MSGLTIHDFYDPRIHAKGGEVPIYPPMTEFAAQPAHARHSRQSEGNADNVLLHIPAGRSNTYTYDVPKTCRRVLLVPQSPPHADDDAGLLRPGRAARDRTPRRQPAARDGEADPDPQHGAAIQLRVRPRGGPRQLNNPNWPQYVSTLKGPEGDALANGTYRPLLVPTNFLDSKKGTQYATIWYTGIADWNVGPGSIPNSRGQFHFIPSNLQRFTAKPGGSGHDVPANPSLPDYKRDVQFTINGQFQPVIKSKAGQTEIWVLSNISDMVYVNAQLTETATGKHPKIAVVGQDGNPYPEVQYPRSRRRHPPRHSAGDPLRHRRHPA